MSFTRRDFVRGGVSAFTLSFAAPRFLCDLALAQGAASRNLVVVYLSGGNDSLSMLVPYTDPFYVSRRPSIFLTAAQVLKIGRDSAGNELGLHPRLSGLRGIFDQGRLALIQRTGYENSSRSHFQGTDIWSTANPVNTQGPGWLGRYLDTLPSPVDPLAVWNTTGQTPHTLQANLVSVPSIPNPATYAFNSPNGTTPEAQNERVYATKISSHVPVNRPHLAFVNGTAQAAFATLDRVASVAAYAPTVTYNANNGFAQALKAVAGVIARGIGTRVFWVQTGGFDTHAGQGVQNGGYAGLMTTLNDGLTAFYNDLNNQGLLSQTMILQFSEFGRRIAENGSAGTDHGAASVMMAMGGPVRGGVYGTAPNLNPNGNNPTLENGNNDVRYETDFRSVYAKVIDSWLGGDSTKILGGSFKNGPNII
ncbi:MAG TPA: DUF1501 domain-containing protein [Vicinamibacterales bacterium]|nr:DUF1501 domain-containing protein [Vicinamibacterales bacterium]